MLLCADQMQWAGIIRLLKEPERINQVFNLKAKDKATLSLFYRLFSRSFRADLDLVWYAPGPYLL